MPYPRVKVRAKLKPDPEKRELYDRGLLYPHPDGHRGHWVGWRECTPEETPEHVIPPAPGVELNSKGQVHQQTSDLFLAGWEIRLLRTAPVSVEETPEIRRAFADGDLEKVED